MAQAMGAVHLYVRTCRCAPFPYLKDVWTDCTEIWCVARNPLARRFANVYGVVQLHVGTCRCVHFPYLGNGWTDCAEIFGMWLETH